MKKLIPCVLALSLFSITSARAENPVDEAAVRLGHGVAMGVVGVLGGCLEGGALGAVGAAVITRNASQVRSGFEIGCGGGAVVGAVGAAVSGAMADEVPAQEDLSQDE